MRRRLRQRQLVVDLLQSLIDKSLVFFDEQPDGGARYRLLEMIRQYARERLAEAGHADTWRGRHHIMQ